MSAIVFTVIVALLFGLGISWAFRRFHEVGWFLALLPMLLIAGFAASANGNVLGICAGVAGFCLWAATVSNLMRRVIELERRLDESERAAKKADVPPPAWPV